MPDGTKVRVSCRYAANDTLVGTCLANVQLHRGHDARALCRRPSLVVPKDANPQRGAIWCRRKGERARRGHCTCHGEAVRRAQVVHHVGRAGTIAKVHGQFLRVGLVVGPDDASAVHVVRGLQQLARRRALHVHDANRPRGQGLRDRASVRRVVSALVPCFPAPDACAAAGKSEPQFAQTRCAKERQAAAQRSGRAWARRMGGIRFAPRRRKHAARHQGASRAAGAARSTRATRAEPLRARRRAPAARQAVPTARLWGLPYVACLVTPELPCARARARGAHRCGRREERSDGHQGRPRARHGKPGRTAAGCCQSLRQNSARAHRARAPSSHGKSEPASARPADALRCDGARARRTAARRAAVRRRLRAAAAAALMLGVLLLQIRRKAFARTVRAHAAAVKRRSAPHGGGEPLGVANLKVSGCSGNCMRSTARRWRMAGSRWQVAGGSGGEAAPRGAVRSRGSAARLRTTCDLCPVATLLASAHNRNKENVLRALERRSRALAARVRRARAR